MRTFDKLLTIFAALVIATSSSCDGKENPTPDSGKGNNTSTVKAPHIFVARTDGYHTFRIPALAKSKKGTLLAFCEGRKLSGSDTGDINLILRRSTDGGTTWGNIITVWDLSLIHI